MFALRPPSHSQRLRTADTEAADRAKESHDVFEALDVPPSDSWFRNSALAIILFLLFGVNRVPDHQQRGLAYLICGVALLAWGAWHFNDPEDWVTKWGMPNPQKWQYHAILGGMACVVGGVSYVRARKRSVGRRLLGRVGGFPLRARC